MREPLVKFVIGLSTLVIMLMAAVLLLLVFLAKIIIAVKYHFPHYRREQPLAAK